MKTSTTLRQTRKEASETNQSNQTTILPYRTAISIRISSTKELQRGMSIRRTQWQRKVEDSDVSGNGTDGWLRRIH